MISDEPRDEEKEKTSAVIRHLGQHDRSLACYPHESHVGVQTIYIQRE